MKEINPNHTQQRSALRILGPLILLVGIGFAVVGFVDIFSSFSRGRQYQPPQYFWCVFVGGPLAAIGFAICRYAFMGNVARYTAGELAPVGKDTFNYVATETKEGVEDISEAIFNGASKAAGASIEDRIRRLESLMEQGLIDREDFEEQKDRILSEI